MECTAPSRKTYSVRVEDIPDHERLIFKLIFSVSFKTRGRTHAYALHSERDGGAPDLILSGASRPPDAPAPYALIVDRDEVPGLTCIQRPLIASRVLGALDRLIASAPTPEASAEPRERADIASVSPDADTAEPAVDGAAFTPAQSPSPATADEGIAFSISEEEASELAIVHDASLANPANLHEVGDGDRSGESFGGISSPVAAPEGDPSPVDAGPDDTAISADASPTGISVSPLGVREATPLKRPVRRARLPRALVVDDSASVRKQIELELNYFAVEVDYAGTAAEAARLLNDNYYDVAFLDVVLPDTDGFRICKRIKATSRTTSVIMLTGRATQADKVKGALAGCDDYLVKPVARSTFQGTVQGYLEPVSPAQVGGA